ncbi:hypothetical protein L3Q82_018666, partial [Scortum barcoo]
PKLSTDVPVHYAWPPGYGFPCMLYLLASHIPLACSCAAMIKRLCAVFQSSLLQPLVGFSYISHFLNLAVVHAMQGFVLP